MLCRASQPHFDTPSTKVISAFWEYRYHDAELSNPVDPLYYSIPRRPTQLAELDLVLVICIGHLHAKGRGRFMFTFLALSPLRFI